jgi:hypothetical protein
MQPEPIRFHPSSPQGPEPGGLTCSSDEEDPQEFVRIVATIAARQSRRLGRDDQDDRACSEETDGDPLSEPNDPASERSDPTGEPSDPVSGPGESVADPGEVVSDSSEPASGVGEPVSEPTEPELGTTVREPDSVPQADPVARSTVPSVASAGPQGPSGQRRGVLFVILLSIVTFGIYHLYWVYKVYDEMKSHTGEGIGGVLGLVIAIIINPINWFVMPSEVGRMYRRDGQSPPTTGWAGLWILLPIVGWFVWTVKVQRALNHYWERRALLA